MPHLKSIPSLKNILLVLVRLFYHTVHLLCLCSQVSKYNSWFEEARYYELRILHYSHMVESPYKDFDIHDQYMLAC